ncbi:conserved protein [Tepidicaulis marinus]|jgi:hypothetical protein|uniref:Conserved protein n=1 Tax=Tepidicaulis marinus TaxID=1333998 RepID=A0A081BB86_9HYPH|nr:hypothetical protein [Tepidicaulis marinus]GAK45304.1 conserved protein [Tepidicaulis marinus]
MPSLDEILQALRGAIGIALGDENAMRHFEVSTEAFFRSFFAFIPALPFYLLITTAEWRIISETPDVTLTLDKSGFLAVKLLSAALSWIVFPVVLGILARPLRITRSYAQYIIAYNWASLPVLAAASFPFVLYSIGMLPKEGVSFIYLFLLLGILWYRWKIALAALGAGAGLAAGVVVLDIGTEIMVEFATGAAFF